MLIVGLTGSIGMGKSTVAARFREHGISVCDADAIVHDLYESIAVPSIAEAFPGVTTDNKIDRQKLSLVLMEEPARLKELEKIIHPMVREQERQFLQKEAANDAPLAVLEIPLLFETGANDLVDVTIVVSTSPEIQKARVFARSDITPEKFEKLCSRQMSDKEKRTRADVIIDNNGTIEETHQQVDALIEKLKVRSGKAYERHWT